MISFIICLALLIGGYFVYGKVVENTFAPDDRETNDAMELARMCARAADDAKAENVRVYDLRGMSSLTDFMVVCTGLSVPHLRAVIRELEEAVREKAGALPTYVEDTPVALWSVVDYIDVMVHIMGQETREFYGMDTLWKDAPVVEY